jgi:hypothetical protein
MTSQSSAAPKLQEQEQASFTSRKLDYCKACNFDPRVEPYDFKVVYLIAQHINEKTGMALLSDETIADETGGSPRSVRRSRNRLRDAGWLSWRRTSTANIYALDYSNVGPIFDLITVSRDERRERRGRRRKGIHDRPLLAEHNRIDRPGMATPDRPGMAEHDRPLLADIHPIGTP